MAPVDGTAVVTDNLSVRAGEGASASAAAAAGAGVGADLLQPAGSDGGKEGSLVPVAGTVRGEYDCVPRCVYVCVNVCLRVRVMINMGLSAHKHYLFYHSLSSITF